MPTLSERHFSGGPPNSPGGPPASREQNSCHRCHLAEQLPGKHSWVFIIKSRLSAHGFPKAVAIAPLSGKEPYRPPEQMRCRRAPPDRMDGGSTSCPLEPQPLGPAKPEFVSQPTSHVHWLEWGFSKTVEAARIVVLGLQSAQNHQEDLLTADVQSPSPAS